MTSPVVLACGLATLDVVQTVARLPGPDEKVVADGLLVTAGGPAANAAVTAAALGASALLVTRIGSGRIGRIVAADLADNGIEILDLGAPGSDPALSTVLVTRTTGTRAVVSVNATGVAGDTPALSRSTIDHALDGVRAVLVDGHHLDVAVPLAAAARSRGIVVLLDGGSWKPGLERLLAEVDIAVLSADFALPGSTPARTPLDSVAALGPTVVARSHGSAPIEILLDGARRSVGAPTVEVVDTLGAGDVLHGALLAWLAGDGSGPTARLAGIDAGLAIAAHIASHSCTSAGARGWLAAPAEVAALARLLAD